MLATFKNGEDVRSWLFCYCYTLSHPEAHWVFSDRTMGLGTSASSIILSICHHDYSVCSSIPEFHSPLRFTFLNFALFHVSILLCIFTPPCSIFVPQTPNPDICPILVTLTWFPLILIHSEPHVCSSIWNWNWLSLELLVRTSKPSSVSCPKFKDSRCLVAQHISQSQACQTYRTSVHPRSCPSS